MRLRFKITLYFNIYYNIVKLGIEGIFQQSCPQYRKRDAEDVVPYEHDLKCAVVGVGVPDNLWIYGDFPCRPHDYKFSAVLSRI